MLRGGAFKPRTSPYSFQGLKELGLDYLKSAREETGLPIVTEIMSADKIERFVEDVDVIQVGRKVTKTSVIARSVATWQSASPASEGCLEAIGRRSFLSQINDNCGYRLSSARMCKTSVILSDPKGSRRILAPI